MMSGSEPISQSRDDVWVTWQIVASGLSMFDVNVTTNMSAYTSAGSDNRGFATFEDYNDRSYCCCPCWADDSTVGVPCGYFYYFTSFYMGYRLCEGVERAVACGCEFLLGFFLDSRDHFYLI